ncbi:helix-turn-helix domain-containing protein [Salmonella enterica]|uniref:helix-turn-helix domain-containing protein n=1 Tax=Salmonella enterica TaxID=28901 RepID=UPI0010A8E621|nr:helix-turn-helix transcriptional regulator [Salmonella enterica]QCG54802.1 helix-turn-helix transcriptional regulator [Salmonella enterica subsp. enterica serovar 1,4,[5],12:i:-]
MTKENHNTEIAENSEFDFFDFSDVDPFFTKKNAVANELLALISHENISRKQLCESLDWAPSRLSKVLSGEQNITVKTITAISLALGYDFSIYFHKIHKKEMVQPWEKTSYISNISQVNTISEIKKYNINVHIQSKEDVMMDLLYGRGKESYLSVSVNEKAVKNKEIEKDNVNKNTLTFSGLSSLKTFNVTPKMVNSHG